MTCILVWLEDNTETPSVIGPYDSVKKASEDANILRDRGAYKCKLTQINNLGEGLASISMKI